MSNHFLFLEPIVNLIVQVPPIPTAPSPIKNPVSGTLGNPDLSTISSIVTTTFTALALFIGYRFGIRKAKIEPVMMESTIESNLANAGKLNVEKMKLEKELEIKELEIIEKKLVLGQSLSESQSEYLETYKEGLGRQTEYIQKQEEYMLVLRDYVQWQKQYIEDIGRSNIELIGTVQKLILRAIGLFLILTIYKELEDFFHNIVEIELIAFHSFLFLPLSGNIEAIIRIIINSLPHAVYEVIIFSWGIPLFNEVNKFVGFDLSVLPISLDFVAKMRQAFNRILSVFNTSMNGRNT
jgi:hypothetical protein